MDVTAGGDPVFIDTVLFFCDIEGSTQRWDADPATMRLLLEHHDTIVADVIAANGGELVKTTGDGALGAFMLASDAAAAAFELMRRLGEAPLDIGVDTTPLVTRIGLHRGVVERRDGDLHGPAVHRCARIMSAAHGGQVLVSAVIATELHELSVAAFSLVDRGVHRLRGFHQHEHISELVASGQTPSALPLRTENAAEGRLPALAGDEFIGREEEAATVISRIAAGRVVTIVGPGGMGKTRLAVQVAQQVRNDFPDGVWFIDLATIDDHGRVLPTIADDLGVAEPTDGSLADAVAKAFMERRVLVVLDNCEHVLDGVRAALTDLLGGPVTASILATSQRDLGLRSETVVPLGPLATGPDALDSPAGRLFVSRALAADPTLEVDSAAEAHIHAICQRLEGLPLALELAASRVRVTSLAEIAEQLTVTFGILRNRDKVDRHRTLDAAIDWSLDLLEPADRDTLLAVSVFSAGFPLRGAVAITEADEFDVIDSLDELVRRSLVVRTGTRFRLREPVKMHCRALLADAGTLGDVQDRHARWMASTVPRPFDDQDPTVVASRLDAVAEDLEDTYAAFRHLVAHRPSDAARLAVLLRDFWLTRGRGQEAIAVLSEIDVDTIDPVLATEVLGDLAYFGWTFGRVDEGEAAARRAIEIASRAGLGVPARAATWLAIRLAFTERLDEATELAAAAERELRRESSVLLAECLGPLAVIAALEDDTERALRMVTEAIERARQHGVLRILGAVGNLLVFAPEHPDSEPLRHEALDLARTVGRDRIVAQSVLAIAKRRLHEGDVASYLLGAADFCDLLVDIEPTSALMTLQSAIEPSIAISPRAAAILVGATERLAIELNQAGSAQLSRSKERSTERMIATLGAEVVAAAVEEGRTLSLDQSVDLLRWLADSANEQAA